MKTRMVCFKAVFLILLSLILNCSVFANSDDPIPNYFEGDFALFLSTEVTETYCGGCVGSIDLSVSGGQLPYTYSWSNSATTEDIDNLCIGVYNVTVTDAAGCTGTANPFVGQNNYPNVELESQAEVDAYVDNYNFCGEVPGVLRIGTTFANPPSDITDLSGLSFITTVGSNLFIFQNPNLSSLDGLQNISSIGNTINITNNNNLTDISALSSITDINGGLTIDNCGNLASLNGLNQLTSIDGNVYLAAAHDLTSLAPLSNLHTVNGELDIRICTSLTSFNGLENLTTINGDLVIRDNIVLNDISALNHPINITGNLEIQNTELSNCSIIPICELLDAGASASISNNNDGCNSSDQILMNCSGGPTAIDLEPTAPTCFGICDGAILVSLTGGTPPFVYEWSNAVTSNFPLLPNLCPDEYSVTVTDADGATISSIIELIGPEPIAFDISITSTECYQDCGFDFDLIITGGTPPYSYSGLPADLCVDNVYSLTILDNNGCSSIQNFLISPIEPPNFVLDETGHDINNLSNGYFDISVTGGIGPFTYEWYLDGMLVSTDEDPTGLAAGTYTLVLNDGGCLLEFGPFTIDAITGIEDLEHQQVQIFPVPAKDYIQVQFESPLYENVPYSLWNASGTLIQSGSVSNDKVISLERFSSGVYFLKMELEGEVLVRKVVKE